MTSSKNLNDAQPGKLVRNLSLFEATMFGISYVIGTGVFLKPTSVLSASGSTFTALMVWVLAGIISLCSALTIAELAAYIPKLGGLYTYLTEIYGEIVGFMYGWVTILVAGPGGSAASAIAFSTFASYFIEMNHWQMKLLSFALVLLFGFIQILSTKGVTRLQVLGTVGKLAPVFAIVIFGLFQGGIPGAINMDLVGDPSKVGISAALIGALWAYDGWVATCTLGEELVDSEKNLPKAIVMALAFVILVYAAFNFVIFRTIDAKDILATDTSAGVLVAEQLFGGKGAMLVSLGVLISSAFTMNAQMMTNERYILPMARRGQLPASKLLSIIHPKFNTPISCIILQMCLTSSFLFVGNFEILTGIEMFVVWTFFTLAVFGVFILRKNTEKQEGLYRTPLFPIVPIIGIAGGGYLVISTLFTNFTLSIVGIGVGLIGLPIFFYFKKKNQD